MNITIDNRTLIDQAKYKSGLAFGEMAREIGVSQNRISEWRTGKSELGTDEVAYFADKAGLPILDTVMALRPKWAHVWAHAKDAWQRT